MSKEPLGLSTVKGFVQGLWAKYAERAGLANAADIAYTANKAEKDIEGNIIDKTYIKKKGATFTPAFSIHVSGGTGTVPDVSIKEGYYLVTGLSSVAICYLKKDFSDYAAFTLRDILVKHTSAKQVETKYITGETFEMGATLTFYEFMTV